uniref:R13L1/DRL21-like LRR repeat region domain-containing protein n=1 Tax=Kalanchoe fedtschenkoi TaxID=63787 RepID=A0A7N0RD59_KALFE
MSNFKLLRVLSLNGYHISTLPKSVGDMKLLRLLDLSRTQIDHLPDMICRLYNLQILLLSHCLYLKKLPSEICNLVNLRRLDVDGTNLEEMPDGIRRMKNIRTLSNFIIGRGKSNQMREFKELVNLQGKLHISRLNNVEDANDVVIAGFKQKEYLEGLVLEWEAPSEQDEKVLDAIEAHKNLKSLTIKGYGGKRLSDWIVGVSPSFNAMVSLRITDCFNCEALPPLGNLPFLRDLELERLDRVESIGEEFYGDIDTPFQSLEKLTIVGMKVLKTWCFPGINVRAAAFQALEDLQIRTCPELTKIPYCFPSLSGLLIESCDNLVKFEIGPNYLTKLSTLMIYNCEALECLPDEFQKATTLRSLFMDGCPNLCATEAFGFPANLRILRIRNCGKMKPFVKTVLPTLTSLTLLELRGFPDITSLDHCLPESIQTLKIWSFPRLKSLTGVLPNLKHLRKLDVEDCPRLRVLARNNLAADLNRSVTLEPESHGGSANRARRLLPQPRLAAASMQYMQALAQSNTLIFSLKLTKAHHALRRPALLLQRRHQLLIRLEAERDSLLVLGALPWGAPELHRVWRAGLEIGRAERVCWCGMTV